MQMKRAYRIYDKEFKEDAVKLVIKGGKTVASVARDLGIHPNLIYNWKKQYLEDKDDAFPGKGHLKPDDLKWKQLNKRLRDVEEQNAILKKAKAGIVFEPENSNDLAKKIVFLYRNKKKLKNYGKSARNFILKHYDRKIISKKFEELLFKLV